MSIDPLVLSEDINRQYKRYLSTSFVLQNPSLRKNFAEKLSKTRFVKGPFLEGNPAYLLGKSVDDLVSEGILHNGFKKFIFKVFPYLKEKNLYLHQSKAILNYKKGRNIVLCSQTGSGKTEAFFLPILDHLLHEWENHTLSPGVRALLLYPMNALANDQMRRLRKILKWLNEVFPEFKFTFGRYTGDTEETRKKAEEKFKIINPDEEIVSGELLSREEMRENPPNILLTNYAMLEYLLLRPKDSPFFDGIYASNWKFLVLDEVHIYKGARGIEMGILIRRLKDRISVDTNYELQCIATSATLSTEKYAQQKVAQFCSTLFGEKFEFISSNPEKQDIIMSELRTIDSRQAKYSLSWKKYQNIREAIRKTSQDETLLINRFKDLLKSEYNSLNLSFPTVLPPRESLAVILKHDLNLLKLRKLLENGPEKFSKCVQELESTPDDLRNLVEIATWSRHPDSGNSLLPAKYHLFAKMPEGCFISFIPQPEIYLEARKETEDGHRVFELVVCRRCGQEYLVGEIKKNKLRITEGFEPKQYYYLKKDFFSEIIEDEDEIVTNMVKLKKKYYKELFLCTSCGSVSRARKWLECDCNESVLEIVEIKRQDTLTKCLNCGLYGQNVARPFSFMEEAPNSVLLTSIYQHFGTQKIQDRRILAFSDSRQRAAFLAPYLSLSYSRLLGRRLILLAAANTTSEDYGLNSQSEDLVNLLDKNNLSDLSWDEREKKRESWRIIFSEFSPLDKRTSLEGVGLIAFYPKFINDWNFTEDYRKLIPQFSLEEWKSLILVLLNTMRQNMAVTFPRDLSPSDEIFSPRNRELFFRNEGSDQKKGIFSWIPSTQKNTRLDFVLKLLELLKITKVKEEREALAREILSLIWKGLISFDGKGISPSYEKKEGILFKLDHRFWRIRTLKRKKLFLCDCCKKITSINVRNICPIYQCKGSLNLISDQDQELLKQNHYRYLYQNMEILGLKAHEHTAQLRTAYATQVQQKFISGNINVLSCSTTFELGVDLGGLDVIFLANVPPEPSNYVQRTGRAGRRKGDIGFSLTFARKKSHDLNYYNRPKKMIQGKVLPPFIQILNEKIVRRHIHSVALASFWRKKSNLFGNVNSFFRLEVDNGDDNLSNTETFTNGIELLRDFLAREPKKLLESLSNIVPKELHPVFGLNDWTWVNQFVGNEEGILTKVYNTLFQEYDELNQYREELEKQYIERNISQKMRNYINNSISWVDRRQRTLRWKNIISFLSSSVVIPKYGFPVDVIELDLLQESSYTGQVKLERDLRNAIAEFAPGNHVIANGFLWKSYAIKRVRNREWQEKLYCNCPSCQRFNIWSVTRKELPEFVRCHHCSSKIHPGDVRRMIIPEFGFSTNRNEKPILSGQKKPKRYFFTKTFFFNYEDQQSKVIKIGEKSINLEYSRFGQLAVLNSGEKDLGFSVCRNCGFTVSGIINLRKHGIHEAPYGRKCKGEFSTRLSLGHIFQTDILIINLGEVDYNKIIRGDFEEIDPILSFYYSLMYTLLEAVSSTFEISRGDLNGCLFTSNRKFSIVLFDDVPGGAGHMKRVFEEERFHDIIKESYERLVNCACSPETSCYGCLKSYKNQFYHSLLRKEHVLNYLKPLVLK